MSPFRKGKSSASNNILNNQDIIDRIIMNALSEDLNPCFNAGSEKPSLDKNNFIDVTSDSIFEDETGTGIIIAKSSGVISGVSVASRVFELVDDDLRIDVLLLDGKRFQGGQEVIRVRGRIRSILRAERAALNFLCHLSGIATEVSKLVMLLEGSGIRILDTRKTLPGLRLLEKKAVRDGGGANHRMGLYDMVLIKDNHIDGAGSISEAVKRVREKFGNRYKIEVETRNIEEVKEALRCEVDRIMLDNMSDEQIKEAADIIDGRCEIEVSGNITPERLRSLKKLKIDFVSFGYITSSSPHADFSLYVKSNM